MDGVSRPCSAPRHATRRDLPWPVARLHHGHSQNTRRCAPSDSTRYASPPFRGTARPALLAALRWARACHASQPRSRARRGLLAPHPAWPAASRLLAQGRLPGTAEQRRSGSPTRVQYGRADAEDHHCREDRHHEPNPKIPLRREADDRVGEASETIARARDRSRDEEGDHGADARDAGRHRLRPPEADREDDHGEDPPPSAESPQAPAGVRAPGFRRSQTDERLT
jgi:hypothetical protein